MRHFHTGWFAIVCSTSIAMSIIGCSEQGELRRTTTDDWWRGSAEPDEVPLLLNLELPFRYPLSLYAARVPGDVTLRLYIMANGRVLRDSTRVVVSSGYPAFDATALAGASELKFRPARRNGKPQAVSILLPVLFRHPDG